MKNLFQNKKLKTICLALLLGFSCIGLVISTVCWFIANKKASEGNTITMINPDDFSIDYKIYEFDDLNKKGIESIVSVDGKDEYNFALNAFDSYIPERNTNLSKIIEANLTMNKPFDFASYLYLEIPCTMAAYLNDQNHVFPTISNVVEFKMALTKYAISDTETVIIPLDGENIYRDEYIDDADRIYQEGRKFFADTSNFSQYDEGRFVNYEIQDGEIQAIGDEDKAEKVKMKNPVQLPVGVTKATFLIQFDYCTPLANYFYENCDQTIFIVNQQELDGPQIQLYTDISYIKFTLAE